MIEKQLNEMVDAVESAFVALVDKSGIHMALKGSPVEIITVVGMVMFEMHKRTGMPLDKMGEMLNAVVAREKEAQNGR